GDARPDRREAVEGDEEERLSHQRGAGRPGEDGGPGGGPECEAPRGGRPGGHRRRPAARRRGAAEGAERGADAGRGRPVGGGAGAALARSARERAPLRRWRAIAVRRGEVERAGSVSDGSGGTRRLRFRLVLDFIDRHSRESYAKS